MELTPTQLALIASGSALLGVLLTSIFNSINTWIQHRSDERKHRRDLIIRTAVENWQQNVELTKLQGQRAGKAVNIPPLDIYIVHMLKLSEVLLDGEVNAENIAAKLAEIAETSDAASDYTRSRRK